MRDSHLLRVDLDLTRPDIDPHPPRAARVWLECHGDAPTRRWERGDGALRALRRMSDSSDLDVLCGDHLQANRIASRAGPLQLEAPLPLEEAPEVFLQADIHWEDVDGSLPAGARDAEDHARPLPDPQDPAGGELGHRRDTWSEDLTRSDDNVACHHRLAHPDGPWGRLALSDSLVRDVVEHAAEGLQARCQDIIRSDFAASTLRKSGCRKRRRMAKEGSSRDNDTGGSRGKTWPSPLL
eukprot:CAMPEP_0176309700 /NCGR_PEP_ID=MMETSP0121_2-20121125/65213_1 /TAXON_ID=160619 /ORGANISM="Kryptoperidinium foliaceum, Strain CCMP 1326" /LENGTH=238 /DNA_ID=CAMNT_0017651609 /DNA_START=224 /DNA_END=940 /DNA_ORIENTATION=+